MNEGLKNIPETEVEDKGGQWHNKKHTPKERGEFVWIRFWWLKITRNCPVELTPNEYQFLLLLLEYRNCLADTKSSGEADCWQNKTREIDRR